MSTAPVAIVTGAARGIGRAIACALAAHGFDVVAVDLSPPDDTANDVATTGRRALALACDIADVAQHGRLLDDVIKKLGVPSTLVNNAGVSVMSRGDLLEASPESYDRCQSVNARGTFFLTQAFARQVLNIRTDTHRSIITVTSANASAPSITRGEYCISKAGAAMMTKLFAARLSNDGVGVYEIQPGFIETDMTAPSKARYDKLIDDGLTVIKRFGSPDEVARIAVTLAQGLLPYTSGQVIHADGGLLSVRY
jgi:NAD(P)-dependent dehydrogenase (short-subunit alcohol dehydrogenase family)